MELGESQLDAHDNQEQPQEVPRKVLQELDSNATNKRKQFAPPTPHTSKLVNSFRRNLTWLLEDQTPDELQEEEHGEKDAHTADDGYLDEDAQKDFRSPSLSMCYSSCSQQSSSRPNKETRFSSVLEISETQSSYRSPTPSMVESMVCSSCSEQSYNRSSQADTETQMKNEDLSDDEFVQGEQARNLIDKDLERVRDGFRFQISNDELELCHNSGKSDYSFDTAKEMENDTGSTRTESTGEQTPFFSKKSGPLNNVKFSSPSPAKGQDQGAVDLEETKPKDGIIAPSVAASSKNVKFTNPHPSKEDQDSGALKETKPKGGVIAPSVAPRRPKHTHCNLPTESTNKGKVSSNSTTVEETERDVQTNNKFTSTIRHSNLAIEGMKKDRMCNNNSEAKVDQAGSEAPTNTQYTTSLAPDDADDENRGSTKSKAIVEPTRRGVQTNTNLTGTNPPKREGQSAGAFNEIKPKNGIIAPSVVPRRPKETHSNSSLGAENWQGVVGAPSNLYVTALETETKNKPNSGTIPGTQQDMRGAPVGGNESIRETETKNQYNSGIIAENQQEVRKYHCRVNAKKTKPTEQPNSGILTGNGQSVRRAPCRVDKTTELKQRPTLGMVAGSQQGLQKAPLREGKTVRESDLQKRPASGMISANQQVVKEASLRVETVPETVSTSSEYGGAEIRQSATKGTGVCLQVPKCHQQFQLQCYQSVAKALAHKIPFRAIGRPECGSVRIDCAVSPKAPATRHDKSQLSHRRDWLWSDVQYNLCTSIRISLSDRFLKINPTKEKQAFSVALSCIAERKFQDSLREFINESSISKSSYKVPLNLAVTVSETNDPANCEVYAVPFDVVIYPSEILSQNSCTMQAPDGTVGETPTEMSMYMVSSQAAIDFGGADVKCSVERTCNLHVRLIMSAYGRHRFPKKLRMRCFVRDDSSRPPGLLAYFDENTDSSDDVGAMDIDCFTVCNSSEISCLEFSNPKKTSDGHWESSCVVPLQIEFSPVDVHYYRAQIHVEAFAVASHENEEELFISRSSTVSFPVFGYGGQSNVSIGFCDPEHVLGQNQQISLFKEHANCSSFRRDLLVRNVGTRTGFSVFWSDDELNISPAAFVLRPGETRRIGLRFCSSRAARPYSVTGDEVLRRRLAIGLYVLAATQCKKLSKRLCSMDDVLRVLSQHYHITEAERLKQMFINLPIFQMSDNSKNRSWLWTLFSPSKLWIPDIIQLQNDSIRELDSRTILSRKLVNSMFIVVAVNNYTTEVPDNTESQDISFDSEITTESDSSSIEYSESEDMDDQFDPPANGNARAIERQLKFHNDGPAIDETVSPTVNQPKSHPGEDDSVLEKLCNICESPVQRCRSNNTIQIPEVPKETWERVDDYNVEDRNTGSSTVSTTVSQVRDLCDSSTLSWKTISKSEPRWFVNPQTSSVCVSAAGGNLTFPVISIQNRGHSTVRLELIPEWNWVTADPARLSVPANSSGHVTLGISSYPSSLSLKGTTTEYSLEQLTTMVSVREINSNPNFTESKIRVSVTKEALSVLNILGKCFPSTEIVNSFNDLNSHRGNSNQGDTYPELPQKKLGIHRAVVREDIDSSKSFTLSYARGHSTTIGSSLFSSTLTGNTSNDSNFVNENVSANLTNGKQITSTQRAVVAAQTGNE